MRAALLCALLLLASIIRPAAADEVWNGATAAFFGVAFNDISHEGELGGPRADEAARAAMVREILAEALEAQGLVLVDLAPIERELALQANVADCSGCDARMAAQLGARYAVVGEVTKISNLILSINVVIREAATGERVRAYAVDIRGNTDESWSRGMRYVLRNGIFRE